MSRQKTDLRAHLRRARLQLSDDQHAAASAAITERLKQVINCSEIKALHYFEPIRELLEPDISAFIVYLEDTYPKLKLCTSRLIGDTWEVIAVRGGLPPEKFDAVLVPMLGFDPVSLHRIGYGGGYYDRFLATQPQAKKIGVCFEQGKIDHIPAESYDIPLNLIVTETDSYPS